MEPTTKPSLTVTGPTTHAEEDAKKADASDALTELAKQNVAPFLAKYHPRQYAPLRSEDGTTSVPRTVNAGYCYRHQPDSKCTRQADEQSMHQLQRVSFSKCGDCSLLTRI
jgi:F-box/WD-40 domain protein MET30